MALTNEAQHAGVEVRLEDLRRSYAGVTALVHGARYADTAAFSRNAEILCSRVRPALEAT